MSRIRSYSFFASFSLSLALAAAGCVGDKITSLDVPELPATALSLITGQPQASIIAVGGTQQLSAAGLSFDGQPVTAFDSVWYRYKTPADSTRLEISSTGLLTGLTAGGAAVLVN